MTKAALSLTVCTLAAQGLLHESGVNLREQNQITTHQPTHTLALVDGLLVLSGTPIN
jgi:hypothetical protein